MKKRVLISGVGGSLFPYLANTLRSSYDLYLIDSNPVIHNIYPEEKIFSVPLVTSSDYENALKHIVEQNGVEYYIPLIDEELLTAHSFAEKYNLKLIAPSDDFIQLCLDKYLLMKRLDELNLSHVETSLYSDAGSALRPPLFIKPRTGRGSRGIRRIDSTAQLEAYPVFENYDEDDILVQEYLDGTEYSVGVVLNNRNRLISVVPKKIHSKKGVTIHAETERNEAIEELCKKVVSEMQPCGPFNMQLMVVEDSIKIFEINPRFSTTSILSCEAGINEFSLCIETFDKEDVHYRNDFKRGLSIYRRWESVFYENK